MMVNHDERFQQRWEFRRKDVDGDTSSDDNRSNPSGEPTERKHKSVTDLVLLENDDAPGCQRDDRTVHFPTVKANGKKNKSNKRKNVVQKKNVVTKKNSEGEMKRKRKQKTNEMLMFKDLKNFADSLINELKVARENMFANMKEELRKMVALRPNYNVRRSQQNGSIRGKMENNASSDALKFSKAVVKHGELCKGDRLGVPTVVQTNLGHASDQVVSSSYFALPTVLPKPRNHVHLNDHIPLGVPMNNSGSERLMAARKYLQKVAGFQPEGVRGFSQSCQTSVGVIGQSSSSQTTAIQSLDQGPDDCLTYCQNSFMDPRIARFPGNSIVSHMPAHKTDGEFVPARLQDGQFYRTSLRNKQ